MLPKILYTFTILGVFLLSEGRAGICSRFLNKFFPKISSVPSSPPTTLQPLMGRSLRPEELVLKTDQVIKKTRKSRKSSSTRPFVVVLTNGMRGIWKPHDLSLFGGHKREVLAYELSELWGFHLVPATVEREIRGKNGSLQHFIKAPTWRQYEFQKQKTKLLEIQLAKQDLFDYLIANDDRHFENFLVTENGRLVSIDHAWAFKKSYNPKIPRNLHVLPAQEKRDIAERLKFFARNDFSKQLKNYLNSSEIDNLMKRVDNVIKHISNGLLLH